jgi:DnaJ-class molecular chaperone
MAKECHPDTHPEEERTQWEERMREINIAYETLMDYFRRYEFSLSEDVVDRQCRRQDPGEYYSNQWQH